MLNATSSPRTIAQVCHLTSASRTPGTLPSQHHSGNQPRHMRGCLCDQPAVPPHNQNHSAVRLPTSTYPLLDSLSTQVEQGTLSRLQLEGVLYACTKHLQLLPTGHRAGFFIADGAGVGKGRQIAAIILVCASSM